MIIQDDSQAGFVFYAQNSECRCEGTDCAHLVQGAMIAPPDAWIPAGESRETYDPDYSPDLGDGKPKKFKLKDLLTEPNQGRSIDKDGKITKTKAE